MHVSRWQQTRRNMSASGCCICFCQYSFFFLLRRVLRYTADEKKKIAKQKKRQNHFNNKKKHKRALTRTAHTQSSSWRYVIGYGFFFFSSTAKESLRVNKSFIDCVKTNGCKCNVFASLTLCAVWCVCKIDNLFVKSQRMIRLNTLSF